MAIDYYVTSATHDSSDILLMIKMFKCKSLMCGKHWCVKFALNILREINPKNAIKTSFYPANDQWN